MANYTIRLKDVLVVTGGNYDSSSGLSVLTGGNIGLANYPIFSDNHIPAIPDYRPTLNGKIFDHFMNQEIGQESIGMFQLAMRRFMNEQMSFFNQMYESTLITINPITTMDINTSADINDTTTVNGSATSTGATTSTSGARTVNSETPQTMLAGNEDYASGATDTNSAGNNSSTGSQTQDNTTTDVANNTSAVTGYQGSPADLLMRYRDSFINTDMMVINAIAEAGLFMLTFENGDEYSNRHGIGQLSEFYGMY